MKLVRYDAACKALADARAVDEVKDLRDKADAMRIYAMQAKNKQLEVDAAEIRIRAERRLGELIKGQKGAVGLNAGGRPKTGSDEEPVSADPRPTLAQAGIDKKLSSRAQALADVPEEEFEAEVSEWRGRVEQENERVTTRLVDAGRRAARGERKQSLPEPDEIALLREENAELKEKLAEAIDELQSWADSKPDLKDHQVELAKLRQYIRTLESQRDEHMARANGFLREVKALRKRLGE